MTTFAQDARERTHRGDAPKRVLVLGGASEARALAARIAGDPRFDGVISLAGRVSEPLSQALPMRVGGFGGVDGLADYLARERITKVIDATHPFAAQISANARAACARLDIPLAKLARPPWMRQPGDRWIDAADGAQAARALGEAPQRVFLTIGRQGVSAFRAAPRHDYLLRVIDAPEAQDLPPRCEVISARGPFDLGGEIALMRDKRIDIVVTKNSGGPQTYAKIEAARALGLDVVMIARPKSEGARLVHTVDEAMAFLAGDAAP